MISLDANVLVYAADKTAGTRHVTAKDIVQTASNTTAALTEQALIEFFHASTRKGKMPVTDAMTIVGDLMQNFALMVPYRSVVEDAMALASRFKLSIWDARLLAVCAAYGCKYLLTEDLHDGATYSGVRVVNPFDTKNSALLQRLLA